MKLRTVALLFATQYRLLICHLKYKLQDFVSYWVGLHEPHISVWTSHYLSIGQVYLKGPPFLLPSSTELDKPKASTTTCNTWLCSTIQKVTEGLSLQSYLQKAGKVTVDLASTINIAAPK